MDRPESVAKIFHPTLSQLEAKLDKVAAMVAVRPLGATQDDGFTVLTWPTQLVKRDHRPVGYLMPSIDTTNAVEIHILSNPSNRAHPLISGPQWPRNVSWGHLLTVATNLCLAVEVVHRIDAVVGDFQERNILVSDTCRVTLVDCDSMQFKGADGRVFPCGVGRPEFIAPELVGQDLGTHPRSKPSDLFALAVHIHLLLMAGNHPFLRGTWTGEGEQPSAVKLAMAGDWAGGPRSRLRTHPLAPPVDFLPAAVQDLFARAFTDGATDAERRPSAAEWRASLREIQLTSCSRGAHQIPRETAVCPWCTVEDERARRRSRAAAAGVERQTVHPVKPSPGASVRKPATPVKKPVSTRTALKGKHSPSATTKVSPTPRKLVTDQKPPGSARPVARAKAKHPISTRPKAGGRPKRSGWLLEFAVGVVIAALLVGATLWALWNYNAGFRSTITAFLDIADPAPGADCPNVAGDPYRFAVRGNDVTTCRFAYVIRNQMNISPAVPASFRVYNTDDAETITVACDRVDTAITCTGGSYLVRLR
ncbi:hypothetical protein ABQE93_08905 [Mycolicibacterium sp. XJ662]